MEGGITTFVMRQTLKNDINLAMSGTGAAVPIAKGVLLKQRVQIYSFFLGGKQEEALISIFGKDAYKIENSCLVIEKEAALILLSKLPSRNKKYGTEIDTLRNAMSRNLFPGRHQNVRK